MPRPDPLPFRCRSSSAMPRSTVRWPIRRSICCPGERMEACGLRRSATAHRPFSRHWTGRIALTVADGALSGFDLFRTKLAVEKPDAKDAEAAASDALASGATGFDRLDLRASLSHGDLSLDEGLLTGIAGEARFRRWHEPRDPGLDVRIALQPALPNPPEIVIRITGSLGSPSEPDAGTGESGTLDGGACALMRQSSWPHHKSHHDGSPCQQQRRGRV